MMQWIVSSAVLTAVVIALRFLLRGRIGVRTQYALWLLVLVRLLVPVSFGASELSVMNAVPERAPIVMQDAARPSASEQENHFTDLPAQDIASPAAPDTVQNAAASGALPTASAPARETDWAAAAKTVWLAGAAAVGLAFLAVNLRFARRLRRTRRAVEGTGAALAVYETAATETPCLFGLARPAIYLTSAAAADEETRRYALAHEQMHYRHGDHLWSVLRCMCLALHWYDPLVWWAAELSRRDAELACDEATVRALGEGERAAYGRTLIRMTCEKRPALLVTATTMTDNGGGLRERIALLVKKPKTAAYTAVAIVLIALIAVVCTFTGREAALDDPFGKTYPAVELVYDAPVYSMTFTDDTMPSVVWGQTSVTLRDYTACDYAYSSPEELTLTAENFDALFVDAADGTAGWVEEASAAKLRRNNARAWSCAAQEAGDGLPNLLYLLQQKHGTLYLALGYDAETTGGAAHFRWLLRLGTAEDTNTLETWESMEAHVLARINALKAPDGYTYTVIPEGHDGNDGAYEWVTEAAEDVRVRELRLDAACEGLSPDGTLELWYFDYEVKPVDAAGVLPERYYWVGDNSISDDGYISDSFYDVLTVLHRADGSYQILSEARMNDGNWYGGNAYESGSEYLYDFYVDYASLDLPKYYNKLGYHRYDGDGWYLYVPTMAWNHSTSGTREEWYSAYLTGSTVRVEKSSDSAAAWEQSFLAQSYTLEQQTENPALSGPWYRTEADGTACALYLASAADGGSYLITTLWKPTDDASVNEWGYSAKEQITSEIEVLRAMAESFAVGTVPASGAAQPTQQKPQKVVLLADGAAIDMRLYRGEGWSVYAPMDWTYTPQWKQWTAPDGAEAHFSINESTASMENVKAYYASAGAWPFETDMPSPLDYYYTLSGGYDAAAGYAHEELYFIPVDESRSYTLSCYSVNGTTSERDKLTLRAMAQSFVLGEVSGGVDANAPTFESDWAMLDGVEDFASFLTLSKDGTELGGYSLLNTWNKPQLNSYVFVKTAAPDLSGRMKLTLHLANNDASYFEFYEGTNTVGYFRAGSAEYYAVSNDFAVGDGVGLYDQIRSWYDEAEFAALRLAVEEAPIPDRGQTWEQAAQAWLDAYEGVHLNVTTGSQYKFTWLKNAVEPAEDETALRREQGRADENTFCFYTKTAFVVESERALNIAMAGNTGPCTFSGAPEGAFEYTRCCAITRTADGWVATMYGTGW